MGTTEIKAESYGILPDTGEDCAEKLREIISVAKGCAPAKIVLKAGTYILESVTDSVLLPIYDCDGLTICGEADESGAPATFIKMRLELQNDAPGHGFVLIRDSKNIMLENLIFDYENRFSSAGEVVAVDTDNDIVTAEVFEGQSHFDGMKCYSANSWNLKTRELNHIEALTIGVDQSVFSHTWQKVPSESGRRYEIQGMGIAKNVSVGDGMSWHFNVVGHDVMGEGATAAVGRPHTIVAFDSENIQLENIRIYSCMCACAIFAGNRDITMKNVRVEPEGTALAVTPRDFAWFVGTSGKLLVENTYVKGVRWDPFNVHAAFYPIEKISSDRRTVEVAMPDNFQKFCKLGDKVTFWLPSGEKDAVLSSIDKTEGGYAMSFSEPIDSEVTVGKYITPAWMTLDEAIFRNVTIEGNCGTGLLYQDTNLLVENCTFRNNTYDDIALGPIDPNEGCFARNIIIRNSLFESSTWVNKFHTHDGAIAIVNGFLPMRHEPYNTKITITGNTIRNHKVGISARSARGVTITDNRMENVETEVLIGGAQDNVKEN